MKALMLGLCLGFMVTVGCAGVSNVSYPLADGTFQNQRVVSDPHAFAPTQSRSWLEICQPKADNPKEADYTNCSPAVDLRFATVSGYMDGIGSAAVYSAGFGYGMHTLGAGIADSGSTTNNTQQGASSANNTSSGNSLSNGQSMSQHQGQGQGQSQGQIQRQRGRR